MRIIYIHIWKSICTYLFLLSLTMLSWTKKHLALLLAIPAVFAAPTHPTSHTNLTTALLQPIAGRDVSGFRNAAYFVNWLVVVKRPLKIPTDKDQGNLRTRLLATAAPSIGADPCSILLCQCTGHWHRVSFNYPMRFLEI